MVETPPELKVCASRPSLVRNPRHGCPGSSFLSFLGSRVSPLPWPAVCGLLCVAVCEVPVVPRGVEPGVQCAEGRAAQSPACG